MKRITILGATGSIGVSTLDVIARHPEQFQVYALTAKQNVERLYQQCLQFSPEFAVLTDVNAANDLRQRLAATACSTDVLAGAENLSLVASDDAVDYVMAAIVGAAGLLPTLAAAKTGKRMLLANKEALVMAGDLFMAAVKQGQAELLPIDSEHNAIFQCLPADQQQGVKSITLTASGGPFRELALADLAKVTPAQAIAHPNWAMGQKISVDSATMMNKGLEVIEAYYLFGKQPEVVLHPQSIIHSLVNYVDGSTLAQLGNPDMRTPIAHALAWPQRMTAGVASLDLLTIGQLDFHAMDSARFPCLDLAYQALTAGGSATIMLNAANEIAVAAFLQQQIGFTDIYRVIANSLAQQTSQTVTSIADITAIDQQSREVAAKLVKSL